MRLKGSLGRRLITSTTNVNQLNLNSHQKSRLLTTTNEISAYPKILDHHKHNQIRPISTSYHKPLSDSVQQLQKQNDTPAEPSSSSLNQINSSDLLISDQRSGKAHLEDQDYEPDHFDILNDDGLTGDVFSSDPKRMPELSDLSVLRPKRLGKYLPGTQRSWYADRVNTVTKRLSRAFNRPQLEHLCRLLRFQETYETKLSAKGKLRLKSLRPHHPNLTIRALTSLVLKESRAEFETLKLRRDPSDKSYSKNDLIGFIAFENWNLTDPKSILLGEEGDGDAKKNQDFKRLVEDFNSESKFFNLPFYEVFLLYLDQIRSPESNILGNLSEKFKVTVELINDSSEKGKEPSTTTGLMVRGQMKARDRFFKEFERLKRPIRKSFMNLSSEELFEKTYLNEHLLKDLSTLINSYLEIRTDDGEVGLLVYSYEEGDLNQRVIDALKILNSQQSELDEVPIMIKTRSKRLKGGEEKDEARLDKLFLQPFFPRSSPTWYISSSFEDYSRLKYPTKRLEKVIHNKSEGNGPVDPFEDVLSLEGGLGLIDQIKGLVKKVPRDSSSIKIKTCFGNYLYPRKRFGEFLGPTFEGFESFKRVLSRERSGIKLRPTFIPSAHESSNYFFGDRFEGVNGSEKSLSDDLSSTSVLDQKFAEGEIEIYKMMIRKINDDGNDSNGYDNDDHEKVFYRKTIFKRFGSDYGLGEKDLSGGKVEDEVLVEKVWIDRILILIPESSMDCLIEIESSKIEDNDKLNSTDDDYDEEKFIMIKKQRITQSTRPIDESKFFDRSKEQIKTLNENNHNEDDSLRGVEGEKSHCFRRVVKFEDLRVEDLLIVNNQEEPVENLQSQLTMDLIRSSDKSKGDRFRDLKSEEGNEEEEESLMVLVTEFVRMSLKNYFLTP